MPRPRSPKSSIRRPKQERSRATVDAILEAASQILRADGLEACGTSAVAKRAGVSVGSLYQYFPNKEAIFEALIDRLMDAHNVRRKEIIETGPAVLELGAGIQGLIDDLTGIHLLDPDLQAQLQRYEYAHGLGRLEALDDEMRARVEAALRRHADLLRPIDDYGLVARVLVHGMVGVIERMVRQDPRMPSQPAVRRELAAFVAGYLAPSNPIAALSPPESP
jgi:AcrR family transcriptional regulator